MPYRNDLVILGLLLGAVGSGLLVRSGIWRPTLSKEAATFVGTNPYIVKAAAFLRWDYVIGFSWIFVGFVCSLAGTIQAVRDTQGKEWVAGIGAVTLAVLLFAVFSVVSIVSFWGAKRLALRSVRPELASLQWQLLTKAVGTVERGGIHEMYLVPGAVQPSEADKERHLLEAIRRIAQVGELMELRRRADESDVAYGRRLCNFCATYRAPAVVATARRS